MDRDELYLAWSRGDHLTDEQMTELYDYIKELHETIQNFPHIVGRGTIYYVGNILHILEGNARARGLLE